MNEELLGIGDIAKYLRVSRKTILRYVREYGMPHLRGPGGRLYFHLNHVCALLEKVKVDGFYQYYLNDRCIRQAWQIKNSAIRFKIKGPTIY